MIDAGLIGFGLGGKAFHAPFLASVSGLCVAAVLQRKGNEAEEMGDAVEARAALVVAVHDVPRRPRRVGGLQHVIAGA